MKLKANLRFEADLFQQADGKGGTRPCLRIWAVDGDKRKPVAFQPIFDMSSPEFICEASL